MKKQKKILIVEDDSDLLRVLALKLRSLDYIVIEAKDGEDCLRKFQIEPPDAVLLDILMPVKDGFDVLKEIKVRQASKIPVIILTNLAEYENLEEAKRLGATDYITKTNLTLNEIMVKVKKALKNNER